MQGGIEHWRTLNCCFAILMDGCMALQEEHFAEKAFTIQLLRKVTGSFTSLRSIPNDTRLRKLGIEIGSSWSKPKECITNWDECEKKP